MVSVVVVVYNVEKYIERCLDSVKTQSFDEIEIIVVDSNSTDRTGEICREYAKKDSRIIYVRKINEGPGLARNLGLQMSKYTYVTFVDGDDWLERDAVMDMKRRADETRADIIVGDIWYVHENYVDKQKELDIEKHYSKIRFTESGVVENISKEFKYQMNICRTFTWGKLYRREYLLEIGFEQGAYAYEDVATVPYILAACKMIAYVNKPVYNYLRNRDTSIVNDEKKARDMLIALEALYKKFNDEGVVTHYSNPLKRLMWGQIRFVCLKHLSSMKRIGKGESSLYEKLIGFMEDKFNGFMVPDQCNIKVHNAPNAESILRNILIDTSNVRYICDDTNKRKYILVANETFEREYSLDEMMEQKIEDESVMWHIVDDIFDKIWC